MKTYQKTYQSHEVICREGDPSSDLYYVLSGEVLVCTIQGTEVKSLAKIGPGEFIGELSFFDGKTRSSNMVTLQQTVLLQVPRQELERHLPPWYLATGKNITKKVRLLDQVVHGSRLRKTVHDDQKLSIDDQRTLLAAITNQDT